MGNHQDVEMISIVDKSLSLVDEHVEEIAEDGEKVRRKGVYLLPNLMTTGALFCGFYAIVSAMSGLFEHASVAIFIAMILDGLDGRLARLMNAQSKFGAEYDSLSDIVSFGLAPALVAFSWTLHNLGKVGWMIAFVYTACTALRLARFNTQIDNADGSYFTGLASPSAAAIAAGFVWSSNDYGIAPSSAVIPMAIILAISGILMVTNFRYHSFKKIDLRKRVPFTVILVVVLCFAIIFTDPPVVLFLTFLAYGMSGPVLSIRSAYNKRKS